MYMLKMLLVACLRRCKPFQFSYSNLAHLMADHQQRWVSCQLNERPSTPLP